MAPLAAGRARPSISGAPRAQPNGAARVILPRSQGTANAARTPAAGAAVRRPPPLAGAPPDARPRRLPDARPPAASGATRRPVPLHGSVSTVPGSRPSPAQPRPPTTQPRARAPPPWRPAEPEESYNDDVLSISEDDGDFMDEDPGVGEEREEEDPDDLTEPSDADEDWEAADAAPNDEAYNEYEEAGDDDMQADDVAAGEFDDFQEPEDPEDVIPSAPSQPKEPRKRPVFKGTPPATSSTPTVLPILEKRDEVVSVLCGGPKVCCILGETGSGKSTQVPQILLQEARAKGERCRVAVTQPRRVAALNLANRVAYELGEGHVGNSVGYRIGGENVQGEHIDFCTVGYLLQLFLNAPEEFGQYTHLVLDEVHERSAESDMLCLVVRLLASTSYPDTRIIVMSATLQSDLFKEYFTKVSEEPPGDIYVGARCFEVTEYFMDELEDAIGGGQWKLKCAGQIQQRIRDVFSNDGQSKGGKGKGKGKGKGGGTKLDPRHCEKLQAIIVELVTHIAEPESTILVFLPGIAEISSLWEEARALEDEGNYRVFPLHSMIPREEQEMVFKDPEPDVTNVVLATDIAESSITLPRVVAVIDVGLHRRVDYDQKQAMSALATKWISRSSAKQRAGRAGRTQPGVCLRLYTREFFEQSMVAFEPPESASMPLDRLYLQSKQLAMKLTEKVKSISVPRSAEGLIRQMIQAPETASIGRARSKIAAMGAISDSKEEADLTTLGRLCLQLPVDLRLARLVWLGTLWGCAADAVVLACVLSSMDPFSSPSPLFIRDEYAFVEKLRASCSARLLFDGGTLSEPLMHRQLFLEWMAEFHQSEWVWGNKQQISQARRRHTAQFSWQYSLSRGRMEHVTSHVLDLALRTYRTCRFGSAGQSSLKGLIRGLGYTVNERGDLHGIPWNSWRELRLQRVFADSATLLKSLLAAAFSDQLFLGSVGAMPSNLELKRPATTSRDKKAAVQTPNTERQEAQLHHMAEQSLRARQTAVFGDVAGASQDVGGYVEFVCGDRPTRVVKVQDEEIWTLAEMQESDSTRWAPLKSREDAPLLDSKLRLPAEFYLLSQFEKCMRDASRAKALSHWSYGTVAVHHPGLLTWEWLKEVYSPTTKQQLRVEAVFDRKNGLGYAAHVQDLLDKPDAKMTKVASFAVAASVQSGESLTKAFPQGATTLAAGHLAFVLATASLEVSRQGFRNFGFHSLNGSLTVQHRCVSLPSGVVDRSRWEMIAALRRALREELQAVEPKQRDGTPWRQSQPILGNSVVESCVWDLLQTVPTKDCDEQAIVRLDEENEANPRELLKWTVDLDGGVSDGVQAFRPLATWEQLEQRRNELMKKPRSSRERGGRRDGARERDRRERDRERAGGPRERDRARRRDDTGRGDRRDGAEPRDRERDRERRGERAGDRRADDRAGADRDRRDRDRGQMPPPRKRSPDRGAPSGRAEKMARADLRAPGARSQGLELREASQSSRRRRPLQNPMVEGQGSRREGADRRGAGGERSPRRRAHREGEPRARSSRRQEGRGDHSRRPEHELPATALGLYDLCRQVAGRGGAAGSDRERKRVLRALERAAVEDRALLPAEREKVSLKFHAAREKLSIPYCGALQERGRTRLMECLPELERRLGLPQGDVDDEAADRGAERREDRRQGRREDRREDRRAGRGTDRAADRAAEPGGSRGAGRAQEAYDPEAAADAQAQAEHVAPGDQEVEWVEGCYPWTRVRDPEGGVYYFNEETSESTWDPPAPL